MSQPWPPPPDLQSIQELVRAADVEGFIGIHGAPEDEYELEGKTIFDGVTGMATRELIIANLLPILERIWSQSFELDAGELALRHRALLGLAQQIEHFFGPETTPQVRMNPLPKLQ